MNPLACSSCGTNFRPQDLNPSLGVAVCAKCSLVFPLGKPAPVAAKTALRAPMPEKFVVTDEPGRFEVSWRWFSPVHIFMAAFCVAWDWFLFTWYSTALQGGGEASSERLLALIFPVAHVVAGVTLTYATLAGFLNRTVLRVENGRLVVRHGPLPWLGSGSWERDDLHQLYCDEDTSQSSDGETQRSFRLNAMLRDGRTKVLVKKLTERQQVQWLEQVLEAHLDIVDQPVTGELPK